MRFFLLFFIIFFLTILQAEEKATWCLLEKKIEDPPGIQKVIQGLHLRLAKSKSETEFVAIRDELISCSTPEGLKRAGYFVKKESLRLEEQKLSWLVSLGILRKLLPQRVNEKITLKDLTVMIIYSRWLIKNKGWLSAEEWESIREWLKTISAMIEKELVRFANPELLKALEEGEGPYIPIK